MTAAIDGQTRDCSACHSAVPAGPFCGRCGADQRVTVTERRKLLRPNVFVAAHRQPVYLPMITSTLFPHLAHTDRAPFRHGLFLALGALIGFAMFRQYSLVVVLTSLAIPLLFVLYLWQSDIFRDIPARAMILTQLIGVGLSVAWWAWTGTKVAEAYGVPLSAGFQLIDLLDIGLVVSAGDALLMLVPAVVVRMLRLPTIESLDGFVIGALGALAYTTASTITWMAPQFIAGMLSNYEPVRLLSRGLLYGVFDPLTAAAAGGTVGLLLWFRPKTQAGQPHGIRLVLAMCTVVAASCYLGLYTINSSAVSGAAEVGIYLSLTTLALLTLRFAMQIAVLHEIPDAGSDRTVRCIHCEAAGPDMPFCPQCGVATRASSRSARRLRHLGAAP